MLKRLSLQAVNSNVVGKEKGGLKGKGIESANLNAVSFYPEKKKEERERERERVKNQRQIGQKSCKIGDKIGDCEL